MKRICNIEKWIKLYGLPTTVVPGTVS